jgi:hypothetical protein
MSEDEGKLDKAWYYAAATFKERIFQPYTSVIGQTALAWNNLQEEFGTLFWTLLGSPSHAASMAVWQVLKVDRAKRDMLEKAVQNLPQEFYETFPRAKEEILWVVGEANKLEETRNNVIHAPLQVRATLGAIAALGPLTKGKQRRKMPAAATVIPFDWNLNSRAAKIAGKHILTEYRYCHAATIVLRDYVSHLNFSIRRPDSPWPDRPKLPNRGQTKKK